MLRNLGIQGRRLGMDHGLPTSKRPPYPVDVEKAISITLMVGAGVILGPSVVEAEAEGGRAARGRCWSRCLTTSWQ